MGKWAFPCVVLLVVSFAVQADAALITSVDIWGGGGGRVVTDHLLVLLAVEGPSAWSYEHMLFEDITLTGSGIFTHEVTAASDADFADFTSHISNGLPDYLLEKAELPGAGSGAKRTLESSWFPGGADLAGYTVTSVRRILDLTMETPGSDPNTDGIWTDYNFTGVYEFYGTPTVPAPGALLLGLVGLVATAAGRRLRR